METLLLEAQNWLKWDSNNETKSQVQELVDKKDVAGLEKAFGKRVQFGTAGLRAEMGPGISCMNDLIILQTSQGLASYLLDQLGRKKAGEKGIVVGFDHRKRGSLSSRNFALICSTIFLRKGFKVYLFSGPVATPFVPFCVDMYKCAAGVMVTASHNPKNDNGFKVYWGNGSQIIPPHDSGIAKAILNNLEPQYECDLSIEQLRSNFSSLCVDPTSEVLESYFNTIRKKLCRYPEQNKSQNVKITYTPMHGIGHTFAKRAFAEFGLQPYIEVVQQLLPDPTFPTVKFPNPEEGKGALELAFETAEANESTLVLANDPDADRLAVAEMQKDGTWRVFTGNEIGALLAHWQYVNNSDRSGKIAMVASTVSSKLLQEMARVEGFHFSETLTGFKWIGNKSIELRQSGYNVIFSFEEAIGFCIGDIVNDKDGVCAAAVFAEMANAFKREGKTCSEHLEDFIYKRYGIFATLNHYIVSSNPSINERIFHRLRNEGHYWHSCASGKYKIESVRDLLAPGYDSSKPDKVPSLPVSQSSQMITYNFADGYLATLRMSGTEPKLKFYTELQGEDKEKVVKDLEEFVELAIKNDMLKL